VKYFDWKLTAQRNLQVGSLFSKRKVTGYTSYVLIGINADCDGFIYFPDKKDHQPVGRYKKNGKQWYVVASLDNNFTYNVAVNYVQGLNYALVKK